MVRERKFKTSCHSLNGNCDVIGNNGTEKASADSFGFEELGATHLYNTASVTPFIGNGELHVHVVKVHAQGQAHAWLKGWTLCAHLLDSTSTTNTNISTLVEEHRTHPLDIVPANLSIEGKSGTIGFSN